MILLTKKESEYLELDHKDRRLEFQPTLVKWLRDSNRVGYWVGPEDRSEDYDLLLPYH